MAVRLSALSTGRALLPRNIYFSASGKCIYWPQNVLHLPARHPVRCANYWQAEFQIRAKTSQSRAISTKFGTCMLQTRRRVESKRLSLVTVVANTPTNGKQTNKQTNRAASGELPWPVDHRVATKVAGLFN
jgi:hypothetical protein